MSDTPQFVSVDIPVCQSDYLAEPAPRNNSDAATQPEAIDREDDDMTSDDERRPTADEVAELFAPDRPFDPEEELDQLVSRGTTFLREYNSGEANPELYHSGISLLRQASASGSLLATAILGDALLDHGPTDGDHREGERLLRTAAARGNSHAMFLLGWQLAHGDWMPRNYDESRAWYENAARNGHPLARASLLRSLGIEDESDDDDDSDSMSF